MKLNEDKKCVRACVCVKLELELGKWETITVTTIDLVRRLQIERRRITMSGTIKTMK